MQDFYSMQKRVVLHILFWISYVGFKTFLNISSDTGNSADVFTFTGLKNLVLAQLALLTVKLPLVYLLFYIMDKYLSRQWRIGKTVITGIVLFAAALALFLPVKQFIVIRGIYQAQATLASAMNVASILSSLFILFFVSSVALAIKLVRSNISQKNAAQEITKKKLETELQFLKAQTNPHFLFNTLNNIYALARKRSDQTADVVMKLSKLLRFMLYESQKKFISIADEMHVIDDYIELEKIRYDEKLKLNFTRSVDNETYPIAPLILLPFVENAFKHGASESRFHSFIHIDLQLQDGRLHFVIENSKAEDGINTNPENIGLNNIRRQLELIYPEHTLEIKNENGSFTVSLKINLNKHASV